MLNLPSRGCAEKAQEVKLSVAHELRKNSWRKIKLGMVQAVEFVG
jgi:hypothetical protein